MRVVVTGGHGLVGRHLVRALAAEHEVVVFDRRPAEQAREGDPAGDGAQDVGERAPASGAPPPAAVVVADLLDGERPLASPLREALEGADAVCHLAAVPGADRAPTDEILRTNVAGTWRLYLAARDAGVRRVVFASSESVLGWAYGENVPPPERLPVDESHPLRPEDPYGLSKLWGEAIARGFAQGPTETVAGGGARAGAHAVETVALRPPWIWVPEERALHRRLAADPESWKHGLWAYVDVGDLSRAFARALAADLPEPFVALYAAAADTGVHAPTADLLARHFPNVPLARPLPGHASLFACDRAREVLGWSPAVSWRDAERGASFRP